MNKLSEGKGNLVSKVENLKKLGAKGAQGHFFAEPLQQLALFSQA